MMSAYGLSELHFVPPKQTVDQIYYRDKILKECALPAMRRTKSNGSILKRKLMPDMSKAIFQQDSATSHTAKSVCKYLQDEGICYWTKLQWPGNSPDLNPIENLWSILQNKVDEQKKQPTTIDSLKQMLKKGWSEIKPETLQNLSDSMPERMRAVLKNKGEYIGR